MVEKPARTRLEQLLRSRRMGLADFQREFAKQASQLGERAEVSDRSAKRWLRGDPGMPRAISCRVLEAWFDEPVEQLLGPPRSAVGKSNVSEQEVLVNAARESVEHAIEASSALDPSALEHLHAAAGNAARAYLVTPPLVLLSDLVSLRDTIYNQLDRTHKPRQQAELYLLAGEICGLLSSVSWDLGHPEVAEEHARAAYTYGSVIDHASLQSWARALQVTNAFWAGRPRHAVSVAAVALETAPSGTARARLHAVNARALALIGARDEVEHELNSATEELDQSGDDAFLDEIGGELGFDRPRLALCAGASYVALADGDRAEVEAAFAVDLFAQMAPSQRWSAGELGAHADLGAARAMRGDLAGARDALNRVFGLEPSGRTEAITKRLLYLGRLLGTTRYRGALEARALGEEIEEFTRSSLAHITSMTALPPGRP